MMSRRTHDERSHPYLQQTPLTVNPFIDLPKAPTLPPNYISLPSTLPPSCIDAPPAPSNPDLPAYVTSGSGYAAHPSTVIAQNKGLLEGMDKEQKEAADTMRKWHEGHRQRDLQEKRRKAPGYLDAEQKILQPERKVDDAGQASLMDQQDVPNSSAGAANQASDKDVDQVGVLMDRVFGEK